MSLCPPWTSYAVDEDDCTFLMLNTSTSRLTKRGFQKWILTCYILELQREPLRAKCLLLENREWWLWFIPHSWRACCTASHLTSLILDGSWLVLSSEFVVKKRGFLWRCVPAALVHAWRFFLHHTPQSKIKQRHRRRSVRVFSHEVMWQREFVPTISRKRALASIKFTHML